MDCDDDILTSALFAELDAAPAVARVGLARFRDAPPARAPRLAYELAVWASGGGVGASYAEHLAASGVDVRDAGVAAAHLELSARAAAAERAGPAAFWLGAWLKAQAPHRLTAAETRVVVAVYRALLAADVGRHESLVRAVLRVDSDAGELAREHAGTLLAPELVAFLRETRSACPEAAWVAELARELPAYAAFGDLADAASGDLVVAAMVELGGVARADAEAQIGAVILPA
jgi:hypothetical protein